MICSKFSSRGIARERSGRIGECFRLLFFFFLGNSKKVTFSTAIQGIIFFFRLPFVLSSCNLPFFPPSSFMTRQMGGKNPVYRDHRPSDQTGGAIAPYKRKLHFSLLTWGLVVYCCCCCCCFFGVGGGLGVVPLSMLHLDLASEPGLAGWWSPRQGLIQIIGTSS